MSSLSRRTLLIVGLLGTLAGCGFTPAYGPNGVANDLLNSILIDKPNNHDTYLLNRHLETRLGRSVNPTFAMSTKITVTEEQMAISANNITNRFNVIGQVEFSLRDLASDTVTTTGTVNSFTGYSATGTTAATQAAAHDARERLMVILADQIITRLIATTPTRN